MVTVLPTERSVAVILSLSAVPTLVVLAVPAGPPAGRRRVATIPALPILDGQPGQLDPRSDPELAEDLPQVRGHGVHAQVHLLGYLLVAQPLGNQAGNGPLGLGQAVPPGRR